MENTIIKISTTDLKNDVVKLFKSLNTNGFNCFEFSEHNFFNNGVIEKGITFKFFSVMNKTTLLELHNIFNNCLNGYNCAYVENKLYFGCIKEILFNAGCGVLTKINNIEMVV